MKPSEFIKEKEWGYENLSSWLFEQLDKRFIDAEEISRNFITTAGKKPTDKEQREADWSSGCDFGKKQFAEELKKEILNDNRFNYRHSKHILEIINKATPASCISTKKHSQKKNG